MTTPLSENEKRAIFCALWEIAKSDRRVDESERKSLAACHEKLFGKPMPLSAYPYPEHQDTAKYICGAGAKETVLNLAFEVLRADGAVTDEEHARFGDLAATLGLEQANVESAWAERASSCLQAEAEQLLQKALAEVAIEIAALKAELRLEANNDIPLRAIVTRCADNWDLITARESRD